MANDYVLINDIIEDHRARMDNLRKYYPFFVLNETTFTQYKDGKYIDLDMGYITMASLRFFINENNFNEREISYEHYERFLKELLKRDFELVLPDDEEKELIGYIFDKIKNDGKAFEFHFFDPDVKKMKTARVKLIDSRIENGTVLYHITAEGIEFYLDTKEAKDESRISVQQLLLEKMIRSKNFKGGIEVVKRINGEVTKLIYQKRQVIQILNYDVFAGANACEEYMRTVARWFEEEQKLFAKNQKLIEQAMKKASMDMQHEEEKYQFYRAMEEIHDLEIELKKTISKHGELMQETLALQSVADKIIGRAKLRKLRSVFDFRETLVKMEKADSPASMHPILQPLFAPQIKKTFTLRNIDNLLTYKQDNKALGEKIVKDSVKEGFLYEDEIEDMRIAKNYGRMFSELLGQLERKGRIDLKELNGIFAIRFGDEIFHNGDYYSFLVHLSQKKNYAIKEMLNKQDTFLEGLCSTQLTGEEQMRFMKIEFKLTFAADEKIEIDENLEVSNIVFERTDL